MGDDHRDRPQLAAKIEPVEFYPARNRLGAERPPGFSGEAFHIDPRLQALSTADACPEGALGLHSGDTDAQEHPPRGGIQCEGGAPRTTSSASRWCPRRSGVRIFGIVSRRKWERFRANQFERSPNSEFCGSAAIGSARHAHEMWVYDPKAGVARLVGLKTICRMCHFVMHPGFVE